MITASRTWLAVHDDPSVPPPEGAAWNAQVVQAIREHGPPSVGTSSPFVCGNTFRDLSGSGLVLRRNV